MRLEPFKYLVQPVAIERDDNGRIAREVPGETLNFYEIAAIPEALRQFEQQLATMQNGEEATLPITEETVTEITCDNPDCPGTDLDPSKREGWLFVSHEVYGEPSGQHVFCSPSCLSSASDSDPAALGMLSQEAESAS
jgi:hypothetical protein